MTPQIKQALEVIGGLAEIGALKVDANGLAWVKVSAGIGDAYASIETKIIVDALGKLKPKEKLDKK